MTFRTAWVALALTAWLSSCGTPPVVAESQEVSLEGWNSEDVLRFQWDMDDTLSRHDLMLDVRHAQDYPYSNLYLFLTYRFPNGKSRTDTVDCTLADELGQVARVGVWRPCGPKVSDSARDSISVERTVLPGSDARDAHRSDDGHLGRGHSLGAPLTHPGSGGPAARWGIA